jgi:menaquinol-cytochrome c reductase iron-sulfur subunit
MKTPTQSQAHTRRSFYEVCIYGLSTLIGAVIAAPAIAYLFVKPRSKQKSDWQPAADVSQLKLQQPEEVLFHRTRVDGWRVENEKVTAWVVKLDPQTVVAYSPACTHLACPYHWDDQQKNFICPCHGSVFSIDGKVLAGPAPRPLDRYVSRVEEGKLWIGSQIQKA